jgi:ParB-like chromosome segregation protein Spo0J
MSEKPRRKRASAEPSPAAGTKHNRNEVIETWPIDKPRDSEANARIHPAKQIEELRASLRTYGQVWPILVREDGEIIAGHGRRTAAALEGMTEIKVLVARGWTEAQCRAFALLDNRVPLNAGWDATKLAAELKRVKEDGIDPALIGFTARDIHLLLTPKDPTETEPVLTGLTFSVIIRCENEEHQGEVLRMLEERGLECEAMIS